MCVLVCVMVCFAFTPSYNNTRIAAMLPVVVPSLYAIKSLALLPANVCWWICPLADGVVKKRTILYAVGALVLLV